MPGIAARAPKESQSPPLAEEKVEQEKKKVGGGDGGGLDRLHHFIRGLLATLPEPETEWPAAARIKWLQTATNIFDLIYTGDGGGIVVTLARADRSPRPGEH